MHGIADVRSALVYGLGMKTQGKVLLAVVTIAGGIGIGVIAAKANRGAGEAAQDAGSPAITRAAVLAPEESTQKKGTPDAPGPTVTPDARDLGAMVLPAKRIDASSVLGKSRTQVAKALGPATRQPDQTLYDGYEMTAVTVEFEGDRAVPRGHRARSGTLYG